MTFIAIVYKGTKISGISNRVLKRKKFIDIANVTPIMSDKF